MHSLLFFVKKKVSPNTQVMSSGLACFGCKYPKKVGPKRVGLDSFYCISLQLLVGSESE